ncbi:MAG: ATP-dependent DNA helicase [Candidatus Saccharimonadales bacterium]|nr:ATP-dependent DNA helicase [Candidatus Saccharimonadales bacterium]
MVFEDEYKKLNRAQKRAVDLIDGPLLVVAGPGTGKTQLLSARVAKILQETDTLPQNILCLTFTDSAAQNMRERLASFIGQEAYDVAIHTYHAFGSEIIAKYPEFFTDFRLERPVDDLGKRQILGQIIEDLPYDSPLKSTAYRLGDLMGTVSELKRALLTPKSLRSLAAQNLDEISKLSPEIIKLTAGIKRFPSSLAKARPIYDSIRLLLEKKKSPKTLSGLALTALDEALEKAELEGSSKPLTAWKNDWLHKDRDDNYVFTDSKTSQKLTELALVLEAYTSQLDRQGLFDFDDMIIRAIQAVESHPELKFNLQELYQYILLDEFQDTNAAQFRLVQLISDNPVNEGRPNVMAVGDDDQAIYAFQGAESSNMIAFTKTYRDVAIVNLIKNYRSHHDILHVAHNLAEQIETRLHKQLKGVNKSLEVAAEDLPPKAQIARHEFVGPSEEYAWVASRIQKLIKSGIAPETIAVLSPKHRFLEDQVPYLNSLKIPVTYEKRENILHTKVILELRAMAELLQAIIDRDTAVINQLFPQILSLEFFQVPMPDIWQVNWDYAASSDRQSWAQLAVKVKSLKPHIWFFNGLAMQSKSFTLEQIIDALIGSQPVVVSGSDQQMVSPMKKHYFSLDAQKRHPLSYYETLSHLSVIREKLRDYQSGRDEQLTLKGFLQFIDLYEQAEQPLINTHPIAQSPHSVQLMTVYKAKGLEFDHVFILGAQDEVWGTKSRGDSNKISLPANLKQIRYAGASEDERLRLLFVAVTRAKEGLILTSHLSNETGRQTTRLKFLAESDHDGKVHSEVMPKHAAEVLVTEQESVEAKQASIELGWHAPHVELSPTLQSLLTKRLENYQMSPTHLNTFIDMQYGGPQAFLLGPLLKFPQAPSVSGEFGNAVHDTLQWYQDQLNADKKPSIDKVVDRFKRYLSIRYLPAAELPKLAARGEKALRLYLKHRGAMFKPGHLSEKSFKHEGVFVGEAHLSGKVDHLEIDDKAKTIKIADFKTGQPSSKWHSSIKLLKYKQQLYMYKLMVEGSHTFEGYTVSELRLEFVEPDKEGKTVEPLVLDYKESEMKELRKLIQAVWKHIMELDLPVVEDYPATVSGSKRFILDLI